MGVATRWVSIFLMVTMSVAVFTVHWPNGWAAKADASSGMSDGTIMLNEAEMNAPDKLTAKGIFQDNGYYEWLVSSGKCVVLNNGIEFTMIYFIMFLSLLSLLSLLFTGGGKFTGIDYFLVRRYSAKI